MSYPPNNPDSYPQSYPGGQYAPQPNQAPPPSSFGVGSPQAPSYEPAGYGPAGGPGGYEAASYSPGPSYTQQFSGPPASSPPVSGLPVTGPTYGMPVGAPPRRGRSTLILAIVAGLLFVLGGVMTGLFVAKNSELSSTKQDLGAQLTSKDSTISTNEKDIAKLRDDLTKAQNELEDTKQVLGGTRKDRDQIEKEKQVISRCLTLFTQSINAIAAGDRATFQRITPERQRVCAEASKYL